MEAITQRTPEPGEDPLLELICSYTELTERSDRPGKWKGLCPFHAEKTPSFHVDPARRRWHCFGACGTGGGAVDFLQRMYGTSYGEAKRVWDNRLTAFNERNKNKMATKGLGGEPVSPPSAGQLWDAATQYPALQGSRPRTGYFGNYYNQDASEDDIPGIREEGAKLLTHNMEETLALVTGDGRKYAVFKRLLPPRPTLTEDLAEGIKAGTQYWWKAFVCLENPEDAQVGEYALYDKKLTDQELDTDAEFLTVSLKYPEGVEPECGEPRVVLQRIQ